MWVEVKADYQNKKSSADEAHCFLPNRYKCCLEPVLYKLVMCFGITVLCLMIQKPADISRNHVVTGTEVLMNFSLPTTDFCVVSIMCKCTKVDSEGKMSTQIQPYNKTHM